MKTSDKLVIGVIAGAGAAWGVKTWLRRRRQIDLADRVVVITGGSSGHGFLVAQLAARRGARLVLAARDAEALRQAEAELRQLGAPEVLIVPTDIADPDQARNLVERTIDRFGQIDILINNAGIISVGPLETMTLDDFRAAMDINFWGAVYTTLAALPHMRSRRSGRIAMVSSLGGKAPFPHLLPYTASKFALTGFTEGLRAEALRDNIFVTGIYPSTMRTGGHTHAWFKGNREAEYAWFAASDTLPLVSISAERVAERLWQAVCDGDPELIIGWPAHLAAIFNGLFPSWTAELLAALNRLLPAPARLGEPPVQGQDLRGSVPSLFTRAVPEKARPGPNPA